MLGAALSPLRVVRSGRAQPVYPHPGEGSYSAPPPPTHTLAQGQCEPVAGKPHAHDPRLGPARNQGARGMVGSPRARGRRPPRPQRFRTAVTRAGTRARSGPFCGEVWLHALQRRSPSFSHCSQVCTMLKAPLQCLQQEGTHTSPRPCEPPRLTPSFPSTPCPLCHHPSTLAKLHNSGF